MGRNRRDREKIRQEKVRKKALEEIEKKPLKTKKIEAPKQEKAPIKEKVPEVPKKEIKSVAKKQAKVINTFKPKKTRAAKKKTTSSKE